MKCKILVLILISLCDFTASAQFDFRPGFIVKGASDTVYGLIDYKGNKSNARKCLFIAGRNKESERVTYTPSQISAYRFTNGKYYISRTVQSGSEEIQLFLEYLINGKIDVFYYRDDDGEHYFIENEKDKLVPLTNEEKDVYVDWVQYREESKKYIGVLKYFMQESPKSVKKAEQVNLNHGSLIKIARDYHNDVCINEQCIIYEKKLPKVSFLLGPVIGMNLTFLNVIDDNIASNYKYLILGNWIPKLDPAIGLCLKMTLPSMNERAQLCYNLIFQRMRMEMHANTYDDVLDLTAINDIICKQLVLSNSVTFRYEFTPGRFRPVFVGGGYLAYCFDNEYTRNYTYRMSDGSILMSGEVHTNPFSNLIYGISVGPGLTMKLNPKFDICLDLIYSPGLGIHPNFNTNIISLNLSMPFRL